MTTYRMGEAEVRLYTAISDSDFPHFLGAFADIALTGQPIALWREAGADWQRTGDTLDSLRDRHYLIHEAWITDLDGMEPEVFPRLRHRLEHVALARRIATEAHAGQVDKNGEPYIQHPERVAARVDTLVGQAVAWLHDVIEDTEVDRIQLLEAGLDREVVDGVWRLTRRPDVPDSVYYRRIGRDRIARAVKLADLADNLDPVRTARLDPEVRARLATKYDHARRALGAEEERA